MLFDPASDFWRIPVGFDYTFRDTIAFAAPSFIEYFDFDL